MRDAGGVKNAGSFAARYGAGRTCSNENCGGSEATRPSSASCSPEVIAASSLRSEFARRAVSSQDQMRSAGGSMLELLDSEELIRVVAKQA